MAQITKINYGNIFPNTSGTVLTTNGTAVYWSSISGLVDTTAPYTWTNSQSFSGNVTFSNTITANGTIGTAGQVLSSNGSGVYWQSISALSVNQAAQYTWTNNHTFNAAVNFYSTLGVQNLLSVNNSLGLPGQVLTSGGSLSNAYWQYVTAVANLDASYLWTNTHSWSNSVTFNGNITFTNTVTANGSVGVAGQVLTSNGSGVYWANAAATSTGTNTQVYFNDSGVTNAVSGLTFNKVTNNLAVTNNITSSSLTVNSSISANGSVGTNGQVLTSNGSVAYWANTAATFSGTNTQVYFNDSGVTNAVAGFTFNKVSNTLAVANSIVVNNSIATNRLSVNGSIQANGSIGTQGQVLTSNGSISYWSNTTDLIVANTGLVANATGLHVNAAYINTISANASTYLGAYIANAYVRTVNGISPDTTTGNVPVSLTEVITGNVANRPATANNGIIYVVSGDSNALNNGITYISNGSSWFEISGFDTAAADARYVNVSGDTMAGNIEVIGVIANGSIGLAGQALLSNGTSTYWGDAGVNVHATYNWTNNHYWGTAASNVQMGNTGYVYVSNSYIALDNGSVLDMGFYTRISANGTYGANGQVLTTHANGAVYWANAAPTVVGSNTQLYFNDSGTANAVSNFAVDKTTGVMTVSNGVVTGSLTVNSSISANGSVGTNGQILTSNGSVAYWSGINVVDVIADANFNKATTYANDTIFVVKNDVVGFYNDFIHLYEKTSNTWTNFSSRAIEGPTIGIGVNQLLDNSYFKHVLVNTTSANSTIVLPASPYEGETHIVHSGSRGSNFIIIDGNGNQINDNGTASATINIAPQIKSCILVYNGHTNQWYIAKIGETKAAGSNTQVQFNNSSDFGASANLLFDFANSTLTVSNASVTDTLSVKAIYANGSVGTNGFVLASNGSQTYWSPTDGFVNVDAQYTWTNTHIMNGTGTFNFYNGSYAYFENTALYVSTGAQFIADSNATLNIGNTVTILANNRVGNNEALVSTSNGYVYWSKIGPSVINLDAQYSWTNNHYWGNTTSNTIIGVDGSVIVTNTTLIINDGSMIDMAVHTKMSANGSVGSNNDVLVTHSNGAVYWSKIQPASINLNAQYAWTNTHTWTNTEILANTSNGYFKNMTVFGNLNVLGTTTTVNVTALAVNAALIELAIGNPSDLLDIGYVGTYSNGSSNLYTGVFRDAASKTYYVMDNYTPAPGSNIDPTDPSFRVAPLTAGVITGTSFIVGNAGIVANGSVGTLGQVLASNGTTVYWTDSSGFVNVNATYAWKNAHSWSDANAFIEVSNGSYIYLYGNSSLFLDPGSAINFASGNSLLKLGSGTRISANNSNGTPGQVLTSNGSGTYWSTVDGVNTAARYTWTNNHIFNGTLFANAAAGFTNTITLATTAQIYANGAIGNTRQVLTSNTTGGLYWSNNNVTVVSNTMPTIANYRAGDFWYDSDNLELYILYNDGVTSAWVSATGTTTGLTTDWVQSTITIGAITTAPTKPTTVIQDYVRYRNTGFKNYEVEYKYAQLVAGSAGSGDYLFSLPAGLQFNTTIHPVNSGVVSANFFTCTLPNAVASFMNFGLNEGSLFVVPYSTTQFRLWCYIDVLPLRPMIGSIAAGLNNSPMTYNVAFKFTAA